MDTKLTPSLSEQIENRIGRIIQQLKNSDLLSINDENIDLLTDEDLLSLLTYDLANLTSRDPKARKKLNRLRLGSGRFHRFIERHGGSVSEDEYARILEQSKQSVADDILSGKLIALGSGSCRSIPLFQINETTGAEIFGLKEINERLKVAQIGSSSACSFWLNSRSSLSNESVRDYLVKNPNQDALSEILKLTFRLGEMGY